MPKTPRFPSHRPRSSPQVVTDLPSLRGDTAQQLATILGAVVSAGPGTALNPRAGNSELNQAITLLSQLLRVLGLMYTAHLANTTATTANTVATLQNSAATTAMGIGGDGTGGPSGLFGQLFSSFKGISSVVSLGLSLFGLFNRPHQPNLNLTPFASPNALSLEVANTDNILAGLPRFDFSSEGTPRTIPQTPTAASNASQPPVQVTMNISAMDSRSFMDNAPAIAQAVRSAMLNMHPINQLVRETF